MNRYRRSKVLLYISGYAIAQELADVSDVFHYALVTLYVVTALVD